MTKVTSQGFSKSCSYKQTLNLHNNSYCSALRYRSSLIAKEWARRRKRITHISTTITPSCFLPGPQPAGRELPQPFAARRPNPPRTVGQVNPHACSDADAPALTPGRARLWPGQGCPRPRRAVQGPVPTPPPASPAAPRAAFVTSCFFKTLSQTSPFVTAQQHILLVFLYLQRESSSQLRYPRVLLKLIPKHTLECQFCIYLASHQELALVRVLGKGTKCVLHRVFWCASTMLFMFS